jgi:hypothetical protein
LIQGFIAEHRDIELLKLRNYTVSTKVDDKIITATDSQEQISRIIGAMVGFVSSCVRIEFSLANESLQITFLNNIVMPDPNLDDDSDDDEGDEQEEEEE